ncbi:hypothetical protein B0181_10745 [Moraxella caviae]|uniref:Uncharacterized protein n=1 Tax=Moraxella caviae TaxID=34060 RepID=A0A1S9ZWF1_9GAMM|nr:hypothetical protein [Moraxella caviae]OOR87261.1 hypothetical protein B0181_10745 [Moraxella caviae]STZ14801.1 Uncharacterised protein [Moraxella caviae]
MIKAYSGLLIVVMQSVRSGGNCGVVVQLKEFGKGTYLNLNYPFPNQDLTIVAWNKSESDVSHLLNKRVCADGKTSLYKGKAQVSVNSINQIKVQ